MNQGLWAGLSPSVDTIPNPPPGEETHSVDSIPNTSTIQVLVHHPPAPIQLGSHIMPVILLQYLPNIICQRRPVVPPVLHGDFLNLPSILPILVIAVHAVLLVFPYLGLLLVPLVDRIAVLMKGKE